MASRQAGGPRGALEHWPRFERLLAKRSRLLLLLDYDGTLAPIKRRPELAGMPASARELLRRLRALRGVTIGIVTGRTLQSARREVGLRGIWYLANHGADIRGPRVTYLHPGIAASVPVLRRIAAQLRPVARRFPGGRLENKTLSLSIHWREVAEEDLPDFHFAVRSIVAPWREKGAVRVTSGKKVTEIRSPVDWDKGRGIDWLVKHLDLQDAAVVFIGDDKTDEDGFRAVNRLRGLSVFVGPDGAPTRARWRVENPAAVRGLLRRLLLWRERESKKGTTRSAV